MCKYSHCHIKIHQQTPSYKQQIVTKIYQKVPERFFRIIHYRPKTADNRQIKDSLDFFFLGRRRHGRAEMGVHI